MNQLSERSIASHCADRDAEAWAELVRRYQRPILLILSRVLGTASQADLQDLLQETYVRLLERDGEALRNLRGEREGALRSFVLQVALRIALDHLRSRRRRSSLGASAAEQAPQTGPTPEELVRAEERRMRLAHAILQVASGGNTARDLLVLRAHLLSGLSSGEISRLDVGLSRKGIETLLRRLLERVRERLQPCLVTPLAVHPLAPARRVQEEPR
jgi:RNA polymerase sigma-70 factor (ECF subfamily)